MYLLLLAVIYLIFISLGLPDSLLGAGWPTMHLVFDMPISAAGAISMIISGGTICASLLSERLTKKFGTQVVTVVSVALTAAALYGFSTATRFWMLCAWAVPYGLGAGAIDSAINNYVALHYSARHMSWLHCFWGVGTIISPYIMSLALTYATWREGYRAVSCLQTAILLVLLCTLRLWRVNARAEASGEGGTVLGIRGALQIPGTPSLFAGFFAYCAGESTAMLWASTYLVETRGVGTERAAAFAALFFIGITAGRFLSGFLSEKRGDRGMIRLGAKIAFAGIFCILLPLKTDAFALAGLVIFGLGCAPVYPSIIHSTPVNFGADRAQAIIGVQMASAYVGSTFIPPLFGVLAGKVGLGLFPVVLATFTLLMLVMTEKTFRTVAQK